MTTFLTQTLTDLQLYSEVTQIRPIHTRGENATITFQTPDAMFCALRILKEAAVKYLPLVDYIQPTELWFSVSKPLEVRGIARALNGGGCEHA